MKSKAALLEVVKHSFTIAKAVLYFSALLRFSQGVYNHSHLQRGE